MKQSLSYFFAVLENSVLSMGWGSSHATFKSDVNKRNDEWYLIIFHVIGKKNYQTSVSDADRENRTAGSTDNAGNEVNLVSGIISLPSGWDI